MFHGEPPLTFCYASAESTAFAGEGPAVGRAMQTAPPYDGVPSAGTASPFRRIDTGYNGHVPNVPSCPILSLVAFPRTSRARCRRQIRTKREYDRLRNKPRAYRLRVKGRKSHVEQIWSAPPQITDVAASMKNFSVGPDLAMEAACLETRVSES